MGGREDGLLSGGPEEWVSMNGRISGVNLRSQACWDIRVLSRVESGHAPLREHLRESTRRHGGSCDPRSRKLPWSPHLGRKECCACVGVEGDKRERERDKDSRSRGKWEWGRGVLLSNHRRKFREVTGPFA